MITLIGHLHTLGGRFLTGKSLRMTGILMGTLFFSASLIPSLLPRTPFTQGLVSGFSLVAGYGVGLGALWLWSYLGLPALPVRFRRRLGALNSDLSADMFDIVADPFQGALWSGPPFQSPTWRTITQDRTPGSPAWLPRFRDGSVIRFTNQQNALPIPGTAWGPLRIAYLQYASDPVVFFDPQILFRTPEWIAEPRGPDVSKSLRWFPIVTMLQLAVDIAAATTAPRGYGHVYAPEHYIDAWVEVTGVDWPADRIARLKSRFAGRQAPVGH